MTFLTQISLIGPKKKLRNIINIYPTGSLKTVLWKMLVSDLSVF